MSTRWFRDAIVEMVLLLASRCVTEVRLNYLKMELVGEELAGREDTSFGYSTTKPRNIHRVRSQEKYDYRLQLRY